MAHYKIYQSKDGLWRASFVPRIARYLGSAVTLLVQAPSEGTATFIADILAKDALQKIRSVHEQIMKRVNTNP